MLDLFSNNEPLDLGLPDAKIMYYPNFLTFEESCHYFQVLEKETHWQAEDVIVYGKVHKQPRLTHWFGRKDLSYTYSGLTLNPTEIKGALLALKNKIEAIEGNSFNTCLANLYRDGSDSVGWHADDERELGERPVIASLSLGASRWFHLKHKVDNSIKKKLLLESGSLLLMGAGTQEYYQHQIPKTKKVIGSRINLTFRKIVQSVK